MLKNTKDLSRPVLALPVAQAVEKLAGWKCSPRIDLDIPAVGCLGYDESAEALLVPAGTQFRAEVLDGTLRRMRCDALVITCGSSRLEDTRAHVVLWEKQGISWHGPLRFWAGQVDELWVIADPAVGTDFAAIRLGRCRLRVAAPTWAAAEQAGFRKAEQLLAREMGTQS